MKKVIIIAGPTAVGKTSLSIKLAKKLNTEIISADSMQIYKGLDIGTAKITEDEKNDIKHHLIDIINPSDSFSVHDFQRLCYDKMEEIFNKGKIPIIVGGTGLYIDSLIYDYDFLDVKPDKNLRSYLEVLYKKDPKLLLEYVINIDKQNYSHFNLNDKKKIIRAIEVFIKSGKTINYDRKKHTKDIKYYLYVLNDDRDKLYERINKRVDIMINDGLIDEVKSILDSGLDEDSQSMKAIGYKEVISYFRKEYDFETMIYKLKQNSRKYAKRQLTWFRRNEYSRWINIENKNTDQIVDHILKEIEYK